MCVCVCVCVTTLAAVSLISTLELNYEQLYHAILFILNSWILINMFRSEVMASFAYVTHCRLWQYCSSERLARPQWLLKLVMQQKVD